MKVAYQPSPKEKTDTLYQKGLEYPFAFIINLLQKVAIKRDKL